jgi:hypothetical protein
LSTFNGGKKKVLCDVRRRMRTAPELIVQPLYESTREISRHICIKPYGSNDIVSNIGGEIAKSPITKLNVRL